MVSCGAAEGASDLVPDQEGVTGMGLVTSRTFVSRAEATQKPWGSGRGATLAVELLV